MLVFSTRLPLKAEVTHQDCLKLFTEWVIGSPHYQIDELYFNVDSHDDYDYTKNNITFSVRHYKDESIELSACRLQNREENLVWDNDCVILTSEGQRSLLIQLNCNWTDFRTDLPPIHKPYIVRMFVEKGYCGFDGKIPVTDTPIVAGKDNYEEYRDIMCGKSAYEMPVVYISRDYWGKTAVSPRYLAHQLSGIAHVFVEENYEIAARLQKDTCGNNAYLGYVGIYFPGTSYCQKHGLRYYDNDFYKMCQGIIDDVWDAIMNRVDSTQYNWNQILALQARQKMLKMKNVSEQSKEELDAYIDTFDKEKKELEDKVEELNRKVLSLRAERDGLMAARGTVNKDGMFYNAGLEDELYPGERNDLLYSILFQVLNKYEEGTRPYCIVKSLLDANPKIGTCETIIKGVETAFRSGEKLTKVVKGQLKDLGFTIEEDGPHYKLVFKDPRYMFIVAKTPSDHHRGAKNLTRNICRALDVEKKL
ncbi:hypothetical protein [Pseudoflavonifractor sp. An176]|uniref:hypothetical protein n=1 Tax=Pseudoflavonifractor sp. An176 TaxID=1965572 RepID=UPI000B39A7C8|nr:hypothetical protein [Pseudoflavonifractor sp. An176]